MIFAKVFEGFRRGDLYIFFFSSGPQPATCLLAKASEGWLWHRRLGHDGMRNLHTVAKKKHVIGIEGVKFLKDHLCGACEAGKITRAKHPTKTIVTTSCPFELLHMDLFGPTHYATFTSSASLYGFATLMTILITHGCISSLTKMKCRKSSDVFPQGLPQTSV